MEQTVLTEIENAFSRDHRRVAEERLVRIEALLNPIVTALPKNEHGKFGQAAVRYALHRLCVLRHGWFVMRLQPGGEAWNASSPEAVLSDRMPEHILQ